ncbi:expressed unknown protein [Seminavis robusta]|uniref:Uncharacterized protein n=1 Tax=Seminavis robusta TaxID=568900 RepID=A0A9N8E7V9_9STRA|nr:expressed unknown protein [Seminavis robusta]|eukprot:Sro778_g201110.1 n/a (382) ;mRNA; r:13466-14611
MTSFREASTLGDAKKQFQCWLGLVACFFSALGSSAILVQQHLESKEQQEKWLDHTVAITFFLLYFRVLMHHATLGLLKKHSATYKDLPSQVQDDSAFSIVDNLTFLMWAPLVAYWVIRAIKLDTNDFIYCCLPSLRASMPYYVTDRILHIWVNPRRQRLIHHFALLIAVLCFTEWNPSVQTLAIGLYGSIFDVYHKCVLAWQTVCRFTRHHARSNPEWKTGNLESDERQGIDSLLIGKSPRLMAFYGKLCALYSYVFGIIVPVGMLIFYVVRHWNDIPLINKIVQPLVPIFFTAVDVPLYKACWKTMHQSYWEQDFGKDTRVQKQETGGNPSDGQVETKKDATKESGCVPEDLTPTVPCFFMDSSRDCSVWGDSEPTKDLG